MFFSLNRKIGNIVITDYAIRYVEIKQGNPVIFSKCEEKMLPLGLITDGKIKNNDTLSLILDECVADWGIKGRSVRFIVPDSHVVIRKMQIPLDIEEDEIRGYLYVEMGSTIHLPFEEAVFDYVLLSKGDKRQEILLFASSEELVQSYTELLTDAHLKPIVADISSLCCYRLYDRNESNQTKTTLLIQFDLFSENLAIFKNGKPEFMRHLLKEDWDTKESSEEKWLTQIDEVIKEIEHVLNFYRFSLNKENEEITRFIITGDHPLLMSFFEIIKSRLQGTVTLLPNQMVCTTNQSPIPFSFHLAAGLALKEV